MAATDAVRSLLARVPALWPGAVLVTVKRVDRRTQTVLATAAGVTAVWRDRRRTAVGTPNDDETPAEFARWRLDATGPLATAGFVPERGDQVVEANGTVWVLGDVVTADQATRYLADATTRIQGTGP